MYLQLKEKETAASLFSKANGKAAVTCIRRQQYYTFMPIDFR